MDFTKVTLSKKEGGGVVKAKNLTAEPLKKKIVYSSKCPCFLKERSSSMPVTLREMTKENVVNKKVFPISYEIDPMACVETLYTKPASVKLKAIKSNGSVVDKEININSPFTSYVSKNKNKPILFDLGDKDIAFLDMSALVEIMKEKLILKNNLDRGNVILNDLTQFEILSLFTMTN